MNTEMVKIDSLITEGLQIRVAMNDDLIVEYAADMSEGVVFDPITVFRDKRGKTYLADGFHRIAAARKIGLTEILADVREGARTAALEFALSANFKNGLRRTNADKHHALEIAWENRFNLFPDLKTKGGDKKEPSARQLAEICGVNRDTVYDFLKKSKVSDSDKNPVCRQNDDEEIEAEIEESCTLAKVSKDHLEERNPVVRKRLEKGLDRFGVAIPPEVMETMVSTFPKQLSRKAREMQTMIDNAVKRNEKSVVCMYERVRHHLGELISHIKNGAPFCVCPACNGSGCGRCHTRGFLSAYEYRGLPRELRHGKEIEK